MAYYDERDDTSHYYDMEYEENGEYRYGIGQYGGVSDETMVSEPQGQAFVNRSKTSPSAAAQTSKIPKRRSSGIPLPKHRNETRKISPAKDRTRTDTPDNKPPTSTQHRSSGTPSRTRSAEVLVRDLKTPDYDTEEVNSQRLTRGEDEVDFNQSSSTVLFEKLTVLEERLDSVSKDTGLSSLDTLERLSAIHERMNQLEDQNFKILEEVAKQPNMLNGTETKQSDVEEARGVETMEKLTHLEDKLEAVVSNNESTIQTIQSITNTILTEMAEKITGLQNNMVQTEQKITGNIKTDMENMTKQLFETGDKTQELQVENATLRAKVAQMDATTRRLQEKEAMIQKLEQENNKLKLESNRQLDLAKRSTDKDEQIRKLELEKSNLQKDASKLEMVSKTLTEKTERIKQMEREMASLKTESAKVQTLTTTVQTKESKVKELEQQISNVKLQLSQAEATIITLKQEAQSQKAMAQQNANQAESSEEQTSSKKSKKGGKFKLF
ncbi:uncharacterized protein LOC144453149 [Glandiceps talaboti]